MLTTWIIAGVVLILLELILPGMVLGFLGGGALIVAALIWWGWIDTWTSSLTTWFIVSIVLLVALRGFFQRLVGGESEVQSTDEDVDAYGTIVDVVETITPEKQGRIHYRGAPWGAICYDGTIEAGDKAMLAFRENLVWVVEAADPQEETSTPRS
jgi:inner membrane protein